MTDKPKHGTICAAIAAAVGGVKRLGKSERNKFDGYDFVSVDKFFALVNPICAEHGLFPSINTVDVEYYDNVNSKGGKSVWGRFNFDISLYHSSGEVFGPIRSMVSVPMNGAQASGSAQSYALKQFFRGMFMIPTGDKDDPDFAATQQHEEVVERGPAQHQRSGIADAWKDSVLDSLPADATLAEKAKAFADAIVKEFEGKGQKALDNAWARRKRYIAEFEAHYPDLHAFVEDAFLARQNEILDADRETLPAINGDQIPY